MKRYKGHLYWRDEDGKLGYISKFDERASDQKEAERKVLDNYWDDRLDAASCTPHFVWE